MRQALHMCMFYCRQLRGYIFRRYICKYTYGHLLHVHRDTYSNGDRDTYTETDAWKMLCVNFSACATFPFARLNTPSNHDRTRLFFHASRINVRCLFHPDRAFLLFRHPSDIYFVASWETKRYLSNWIERTVARGGLRKLEKVKMKNKKMERNVCTDFFGVSCFGYYILEIFPLGLVK